MSDLIPRNNNVDASVMEQVVLIGDLAKLTPEQRISYYKATCESLGLNPLTKPFDYIRLNGKLTLYAKRDATDQLRNIHKISVNITDSSMHGDSVYVVSAKAKTQDGREDESTGAVAIKGLSGDKLANALMKAETKAKRRVTLSIVGLGWIDETEVETVPSVEYVDTQEIDGIVDVSPSDWTPSFNEFLEQCQMDFKKSADEIKAVLKEHCGFTGFTSAKATEMHNCLCQFYKDIEDGKAPSKPEQEPLFPNDPEAEPQPSHYQNEAA